MGDVSLHSGCGACGNIWILGSDLTYTILFPQLIFILLTKVSDGYGAMAGHLVAVVMSPHRASLYPSFPAPSPADGARLVDFQNGRDKPLCHCLIQDSNFCGFVI